MSNISVIKFLLKNNKYIETPNIYISDDNLDNYSKINNLTDNSNASISKKIIIIKDIDNFKFNSIKFKYFILSPSVNAEDNNSHKIVKIAKKENINFLCDIELLYLFNNFYKRKKKYIAITGSNGKSTTSLLINNILSYKYQSILCGNIGIAIFDILYQEINHNKDVSIYVIEISSFQLKLINNFRPDISIILNITNNHLEYHLNMDNYINAKKRIYQKQIEENHGYILLNIDNKILNKIYQENKINIKQNNILSISQYNKNSDIYFNYQDNFIVNNNRKILLSNNLIFKNESNYYNISFAFLVAKLMDLTYHEIVVNIIKIKKLLKYRSEFIGRKNNIYFINDSKSTNVSSLISILKSYDNIYLIAGGILKKNENLSLIDNYLSKIKYVISIGQSRDIFYKYFLGKKIPTNKSLNLKDAFLEMTKIIEKTNCKKLKYLILSPSCASFDQFLNFEERGRCFEKLVNQYKNEQ